MYRHLSRPRDGWRRTVESQGLVWPMTRTPDGREVPYWDESAYYELGEDEVEHLESVTEELHRLSVEAARYVLDEPARLDAFGLPRAARDYLRSTLLSGSPSLYGRFDLRYDGLGPAKLLEYNADTPTGLVETAVVQWHWLEEVMPSTDQWNSLHERLVRQWQRTGRHVVHFAHSAADEEGEEWMTVAYLRDTAIEAGLTTYGIQVEQIGWDPVARVFAGLDNEPVHTCFKLYPWEDMLREPFGQHVLDNPATATWIEPAWKAVLSNKALLAVLWELNPGHENLLPAYLDGPRDLVEWVKKPLHGREGDGIEVHTLAGDTRRPSTRYGAEGYCWQEYAELPRFDGNHVVIGSWVVGGEAAGCLVRESAEPVTDYYARVLPHVIAAPRPDEATQRAWLGT